VENAREVLAVLNSYGSIHAYFAFVPGRARSLRGHAEVFQVPRRDGTVAVSEQRGPLHRRV